MLTVWDLPDWLIVFKVNETHTTTLHIVLVVLLIKLLLPNECEELLQLSLSPVSLTFLLISLNLQLI